MYPELMTNDTSKSPLQGFLKMDQIAFWSINDDVTASIKKQLNLDNADWVEDEVHARGYVRGSKRNAENKAKLLFNYDLGIEIEILQYLEGDNYGDGAIKPGHICHIGFHVNKGAEIPGGFKDWVFRCPMVQQVQTLSHTNQFLVDSGRRYRYTIYDTQEILGTFCKVIERIEPGDES